MDPLNAVSCVPGKTLEEYITCNEKTSQTVGSPTKKETKISGNNHDRILVKETSVNQVTSNGLQMTTFNSDDSFRKKEVNSNTTSQGFSDSVAKIANTKSVSDKAFNEILSLVPPNSPINKDDSHQKTQNVSPLSTVITGADLKDSMDETDINSGVERILTDGLSSEEFINKTSNNELGQNNSAENIQQENSNFNKTMSAPNDNNPIYCEQNLVDLPKIQTELKRVVEDLHNLEIYMESVLNMSKFRLEDILRSLENGKQDNDLQIYATDLLKKVKIHLKELNKIISTKNNEISGMHVKPQTQENKMKTPLCNSNDIDLLLIGSSGNGKSATGNSILRKNVFKTAAGTSSNASITAKWSSKFKELTINVVDSCGVETNGKTKLEVLEESISSIKESLELCNYSFTALLLVIKFGSRFTQHESDTIKMIRGVLGNDVIQKYGVCVVTHGDNFEYEMEEEEDEVGKVTTFEEWCRAQVGEIGEIFKECNFRCALFNNKDKTKQEKQLENLLSLIIRHDEKYSRDQFLKAEEGLSKLTQELFLPEVFENTRTFVNDIRSKLAMKLSPDSYDCFEFGKEMLKELELYKNYIFSSRWDELAQRTLLSVIEPLELELKSKLRLCNVEMADNRQSDLFKQPSVGTPVLDENHFSIPRNNVIGTSDDTGKVTKSYTQEEITKLEKVVKTKFDKLKKTWKTSPSATPDEVNEFNQKIKHLKEDYSDFLKSPAGGKMLHEITKFQCNLQELQLSGHHHESDKWDKMNKEISIWKYLYSFLF